MLAPHLEQKLGVIVDSSELHEFAQREGQRIGDQIKTAFIFARADFVNVRAVHSQRNAWKIHTANAVKSPIKKIPMIICARSRSRGESGC